MQAKCLQENCSVSFHLLTWRFAKISKYGIRHKTFIICSVTLLFPGNISRKFLNPLLFYLSFFWMYISSVSFIIFAEFHDLSCVKVRASWYIAFLRVSLRVSSLRGVGVTKKISALCKGASNVGSCVFSFIYLFVYLFIFSFWIIIHIWFLVPSVHSLRFGGRI